MRWGCASSVAVVEPPPARAHWVPARARAQEAGIHVLFTRALRHGAANGDSHVLARHCTYGASRFLTARHSNGSGAPLPQIPADLHEAAEPFRAYFSRLRFTLAARAERARCRTQGDAMKRVQSVTRLRKDPRHWKQRLQRLINQHNHLHGRKDKGVSFKTMQDRANFLFHFFGELRHNERSVSSLARTTSPTTTWGSWSSAG